MFSVSPCWVASAGVGMANWHPVPWLSGWACMSCPSPKVQVTREQTVWVPSSGSDVLTRNGTAWPQSKNDPSAGWSMDTVGATLPTLIVVEVRPRRPSASVTRSRAV